MLALTLSRFDKEFGAAESNTDKVSRWSMAPGLDVILQQDVGVHFAEVWVTDSARANLLLPIAERVPEGVGRHSNTYWRSLNRTHSALRIRVWNETQLDMLITALRVLREGGSTMAINSA
jgi:hypothetical protein